MADEDKIEDVAEKDADSVEEKDVEAKAEKDVEPEAAETEKGAGAPPAPGAAAAEPADAPAEADAAAAADADAPAHRGPSTPVWVAICVCALVVGVLAAFFLLGGAGGGSVALDGRTTLSADELDSTIATYTFDGVRTNVTARDVLTFGGSSVDTAVNEDGTYNVPAATNVLVYAQNRIILDDAEARGLTASDEEISDYSEKTMGTSDLASIASYYGMDEQAVRDTFAQSVVIEKLRASVCETTLPEQPTEPTAPADGAEDTPTADYASYIIALLGDEWDSEAGTWARTDGDFYATLSTYEITNDSATYAAAEAAYNVAYSAYQDAYTQMSNEWSDYTRNLLAGATIQLGSLATS